MTSCIEAFLQSIVVKETSLFSFLFFADYLTFWELVSMIIISTALADIASAFLFFWLAAGCFLGGIFV
jgi:hypothetical protein